MKQIINHKVCSAGAWRWLANTSWVHCGLGVGASVIQERHISDSSGPLGTNC